MRKLVAGGVVGIAVLLGGSLLAVDRLFGDGPSGGPAPTVPDAPEVAAPAGPLPPREVLDALRSATTPDNSALLARLEKEKEVTPAPPPPPKGSWEAVPVSSLRNRSLGSLGASVQAELNELHEPLARCFDEETEARHGAGAVAVIKDAQPPDEGGATSLVLQLETRSGEVLVVDAPVETRGSAGDGTLACAQRLLRGKVLQVPGATPGERHRVRYSLSP
ncbi:MAG: hypothetical protein IPO09_02050 [Anaeromyxobacter sp.]|nr:hypothetical protein [Anaeromyxobacter sp.]MBL0278058.1 hypothetical protein [Anaeromyxobacter sp.]